MLDVKKVPFPACPKFRRDLTVKEQKVPDGTVFVIKDAESNQFYRFREAEWFLAGQLDGATPLEVVQERLEQKFGAPLLPDTLEQFVRSLRKSGLLEPEPGKPKSKAKRTRRLRGSLLYLRYQLMDPNRLFDRLIGRVGFFFTPCFAVLSAALILSAAGIAVSNWEVLQDEVSGLFNLTALPLISLSIFVVIALHEFAHGLTCKHYGGEVHELGFLLIYFQPAMYCNVSDAWLFPEKWKRILVGLAGPYFELFLWALAALVWRVTDVDTSVHFAAFVIMTSSGVKTLFNLNPLLKLDGYYLLSDYLEVPNLRRRAFRYLGDRIRKFVGVNVEETAEISRRERRIFLTYGLIGTSASFSVIGLTMATLGGFLVQQGQTAAFALLTGMLGLKMRRRLKRLFGKPRGGTDDEDDGDFGGENETSENGAPSPPPKTTKSNRGAWKRPFFLGLRVLIVAGLAAVMFLGRWELKIAGQFDVLPIHNADVRAEVEGTIESVLVDEGDRVQAGDVIARITNRDLNAELDTTKAGIDQIRAKLKMLEAGSTDEEIAVAKAAVDRAGDRLKFARNRLERDRTLFSQKLLSQKEFEDTQELATASENDLAEAKSKLQLLITGTRPEEIDVNQAELDRLASHKEFLEDQLRRLNVSSPVAGIVATPSRVLRELNRQVVKKGDLIAKVFDFKTVTAEIIVSEKDIADVKVGQKVLVKARAYPDEIFEGNVTSIATAALGGSSSGSSSSSSVGSARTPSVGPKSILVTTEIGNPSLLLKPEMSGQAKIYCGERRIFDLVTRRLARTIKVEFWSWW